MSHCIPPEHLEYTACVTVTWIHSVILLCLFFKQFDVGCYALPLYGREVYVEFYGYEVFFSSLYEGNILI